MKLTVRARERAVASLRGTMYLLFGASLTTGILANVSFLRRGAEAPAPPLPVAAATATPVFIPKPTQRPAQKPTPAPFAVKQRARSLGAAAASPGPSPRRVQYENRIQLSQGGNTITLPLQVGTVDIRIGPVTLTIQSGETLVWDPTEEIADLDENTQAVFIASDVPAESATAAVTVTGGGTPARARLIDPVIYAPENWATPFTFRNGTSRVAHVTVMIWINTNEDPGGEA